MNKKTIIFHIGYPKTGSTSLRHFLFPNHKDLNYLGRFDTTINHLKITELLVKLKDNDFENEISQIIDIAKNINFSEIKTNLIADEFIINYSIHYDNDVLNNLLNLSLFDSFNSFMTTLIYYN